MENKEEKLESNPNWYEAVIKRDERARRVERVIGIESSDVVSKGDNYASDMKRIRCKVILGSGREAVKSLIVKQMPETEFRAKSLKEMGFFRIEISIYRDILPLMEDIMLKFGDTSEPMWGRVLDYRPYDRLVMVDLKEEGYKMADRRRGLNLEHSRLAIRGIGKLHALSKKVIERDLPNPEQMFPGLLEKSMDQAQLFYAQCIETLAKVIETTWGPEWSSYPDKIREFRDDILQRLKETFKLKDTKCNVINHGDCWVNSMMFKYDDQDTMKPIGIKWVDWQLAVYNTLGIDLQYFFCLGMSVEVRENHLEELLGEYQDSLSHWWRVLELEGDAPTLEEIKEEFSRLGVYTVFLTFCLAPFIFTDPETAPDTEKLMKDWKGDGKFSIDPRPYTSEAYKKAVQCIFKYSSKNKLF